jgi:subtilisin-like proprotein convertase family protein
MPSQELSRVFRNWVQRVRKPGKGAKETRRKTAKLRLEEAEQRLAPAVMPQPTITNPGAVFITQPNPANPDPSNPPIVHSLQVAVDPTNSQRQVAVGINANGLVGLVTTNGGAKWTNFINTALNATNDPFLLRFRDPAQVEDGTNPPREASRLDAVSPSVAIDRNGKIYITHIQRAATGAVNGTGVGAGLVLFDEYTFTGGPVPTQTDLDPNSLFSKSAILYRWGPNDDAAFNPVVAVNNNVGFSDPFSGLVRSDVTSGHSVYVAWNTNGAAGQEQNSANNPNVVFVSGYVSDADEDALNGGDDGNNIGSFTTPVRVSDSYQDVTDPIRAAAPQIVFSQAPLEVAGVSQPAPLNILFAQADGGKILLDRTTPTLVGTGPNLLPYYGMVVNGETGKINNGPAADKSALTTFNATVAFPANLASTDEVTDLNVRLVITHPNVDQMRVRLSNPSGDTITLIGLRTLTDGTAAPAYGNGLGQGLPAGANVGIQNGVQGGATFDDQAVRGANDNQSDAPYIGFFRPERGLGAANTLAKLINNETLASLTGNWTLEIFDSRGDTNAITQNVNDFQLHFTLGMPDGMSLIDNTLVTNATARGFADIFTPTDGASTIGIGGYSVAVDTTPVAQDGTGNPLFGNTSGTMFLAYTSGTDIKLSKIAPGSTTASAGIRVNDDAKTDHFTEGDRTQFMPTVAVDSKTGTLAITWFDGRLDASKARVANYIVTSNDGGATFSPQTTRYVDEDKNQQDQVSQQPFLNVPRFALDAITLSAFTVEPLPNNMAASTIAQGFGTRQSLYFDNGQVWAYWTGNLNATGSAAMGATATIAVGPRIIDIDQGTVLGIANSNGKSYNGIAADGTPILSHIRVVFDRPVDPATFSAADVTVTYTAPTGAKTILPAGLPFATDKINTTYLVPLVTPTTQVGTYSVTIGSAINDFVIQGTLVIAPETPLPTFNSTDTPIFLPDFDSINGLVTTTTSTLALPALPVGQVIADLNLTLNITHTYTGDLSIFLISPSGTRVRLISETLARSGDDFQGTVFDDQAAIAITAGNPPFIGTFRPEQAFSAFRGQDTLGNWVLEINDNFGGDTGTLNSWSLDITPGTVTGTASAGNALDQNANGIPGELPLITGDPGDTFSSPRLNGVSIATAPLIIPGPFFTGANVPGSPAGSAPHGQGDSLYLNSGASAIDVRFDRDINPASFTPASIIRMTGPYGPVAGPFTVTPTGPRTFRVGFPAQTVDGPYSIEFAPTIVAMSGFGLDQSKNAAQSLTLGSDPLASTVGSASYNSVPGAVTIPANSTVAMDLNVPDLFQIFQNLAISNLRVSVRIDIDHGNVPDLQADLVAPDGTRVRLFTNVGTVGQPPRADFNNTIFQDNGTTNIQLGAAPFDVGTYIPQLPLGALVNRSSQGTWRLEVTNNGNVNGTINNFSLTLPFAITGSGLQEPVGDRFQVGFRLFTQDPTNKATQTQWTPVGPALIGGPQGHEGRTSAVVVDPSDPSGNTVYVGSASGGVYKTTNFLTLDAVGPNWIPLTDFGPTTSLNIGSIAVFPRNNDPNQTIVFALTGEGNVGSGGVGVLRSMDGGRSWKVLDSTNNADANGVILPIDSPQRDRALVGSTGFKIIVDPNLSPTGEVLVYMAISGGSAPGVYRSINTGRSWTRIQAGNATDVALALGSIPRGGQSKNAEILYAGIPGQGVVFTSSAPAAGSMQLLAGGQGNQNRRTINPQGLEVEVLVSAPTGRPVGDGGRIALAVPAFEDTDLENSFYQGWVYAFVANSAGGLEGFYTTKDFGRNWTRVNLPMFQPGLPGNKQGFGTNFEATDAKHNPVDPFTVLPVGGSGQGLYDIGITVNPLDPYIVYLAGVGTQGPSRTGSLRVDLHTLSDPHALRYGDSSDPGGGATQAASKSGGAVPFSGGGVTSGLIGAGGLNGEFFNLTRDPAFPFITDASLFIDSTQNFVNDGADVKYRTFFNPLGGTADIHQIISYIDPVTRKNRLIYLGDQSIGSGVDFGDGLDNFVGNLGFTQLPFANRTGNMQVTQFYDGAAQPSTLAGDIAQAFFYGGSQDNGSPRSRGDVLQTGNIQWAGPAGDASGMATDQTGSGTAYGYQWPCCGPFFATDFFRVNFPPSDDAFGVGRTTGLLQSGDDPGMDKGQWPLIDSRVGYFAINPIDKNGGLISSAQGRVFRSTTLADPSVGANWFPVGEPNSQAGQLQPSISRALAFGAPDPANPGQVNNFLYAGNNLGNIFVTNTGGAPWTNISAGLHPGSMTGPAVQDIVPNPRRGSRDAFAVTSGGVFYNPDSLAGPSSTWQNITGNLFQLEKPIFGDANDTTRTLTRLTALAVDWRYAIPDDPGNPNGPTHPVLYVAGDAGVYRSRDKGQTWAYFPSITEDGAPVDGGYLPNVEITDLDLSLGNVDPATGLHNQGQGGLNLLMATTYGRGQFAIRLNTTIDQEFNVQFESGPFITRLANPNPSGGPSSQLRVVFDQTVDPVTFSAADVILLDPMGNKVNVTNVQLVPPASGGPNVEFIITFAQQTTPGFYSLTVGPTISDYGGNLMNQNKNGTNGEADDAFRRLVFLNGLDNSLVVDGLPLTVVAGTPAMFTVSVEDKNGFPIAGFTGDVGFTSSDPNAILPATYTFVPADNGVRSFTVTFTTAGPQTITATPVLMGVANPGQDGTVVVNAPATQLFVAGHPSPVIAGTDNTFTITAKDQFNNVAVDYLGKIAIGSTDLKAILPLGYQFLASDMGSVTLTAQLRTAGTQAITAMDQVNVALMGAQTGIVVNPAPAAKLAILNLPNPFNAGDFKNFTVQSQDPFGNIAPDYLGTIHFTSSDPFATLPSDYTFLASDMGQQTFQVQFRIAGTQTLTATDTANLVTAGVGTTLVTPAAVANFSVTGHPSPVIAGTDNMFTVTAIAPDSSVAVGYLGTVNFSSSDQQAGLPASYTFSIADNGSKTFTATLKTAGSQSITAVDSVSPAIQGSQTNIVVLAAAAKTLTVAGFPSPTTAGVDGNFTVTARDEFQNVAKSYTGTIRFTSTDPTAGLPSDFTFSATEAGVMAFTAQFKTAGMQTLTATDLVTGSITGEQAGIVVTPAAASKFVVTGHPSPVNAGATSKFTVTAQDPFGNVDTNYAGKVNFSSTDKQADLPAPYTFQSGDQGVRGFSDILRTSGLQSISVVDNANPSVSGIVSNINVLPGAAVGISVTGFPSPTTAGVPQNFLVAARDQFGNIAPSYTGTVRFTGTDKNGALPPDYQFTAGDAGQRTFVGTLKTAGTHAITATDLGNAAFTATQSGLVVVPAAGSILELTSIPPSVVAGANNTILATVRDKFGNIATGYTGTLMFTSTDPQAGLPVNYTFTATDKGQKTFTVSLKTAGTQDVAVVDTADNTIGAGQSGIIVTPAAASRLVVTGLPASVLAGVAAGFTVTARDPFNNVATGYQGIVTFASSDPRAALPTNSAFIPTDKGVRTFSASFGSPNTTASLSVTDVQFPTITGTASTDVLPNFDKGANLVGNEQFAVGTEAVNALPVRYFDSKGNFIFDTFPFQSGIVNGGGRVATADFNGDGRAEVIAGSSPGSPSEITVIDGFTEKQIFNLRPFEASFLGGIYIVGGDITGDGVPELIITPDEGGGPRVTVLDGTNFKVIADFFGIDDPNFRGGARATVGDLNGDGFGELIISAGFGGGPRIAGYDGQSLANGGKLVKVFNDFFAFEPTLRNGVFVAAGDLDGDGKAELIVGGGPGGGPRVAAFDGASLLNNQQTLVANFFGGDPNNRGGVRIAVKDLDGDNRADLITGAGTGAGSRVTAYFGKNILGAAQPPVAFEFDAFAGFQGGVFVG